jgi:hypothetical protein
MLGGTDSILFLATDLQNILGDAVHLGTTMFQLIAGTPNKRQTLLHHLWPKAVLHSVHTIRKRTKALRRLASLAAATPLLTLESISNTESPHRRLWLKVTTPVTLQTVASPPIRKLEELILKDVPDDDNDTTPSPDLNNCVNACFKAHKQTTRLLLKYARNQRRLKYGKVLLRVFLKKPKVALQSILRTAAEDENTQPFPTDLSILRDDASGRILVDPAEVIAQVQNLETHALSFDPTLPHGAMK